MNLVFKLYTMSLDLPNTAQLGTGQVHSDLNAKLRPYQRDGVRFLWDRVGRDAGGILCDDMGLGALIPHYITSMYVMTYVLLILFHSKKWEDDQKFRHILWRVSFIINGLCCWEL